MRAFLPILVLSCFVLLGCTKPNPNRCCSDEADCTAKGIPTGSQCEEGLVCRGNQCIAQPCDFSSSCDLSVPYCVDELCGATCTDDSQCPGFGESEVPYCVDGACVACRSSMDCPAADAAVCDDGACRECHADAECSSGVCDVDSGTCLAEATIAYANPSGSATSACTKTEPCALDRAVAVLDSTRTVLKLAPGSYDDGIDITGIDASIYGPATVRFAELERSSFRIRDLTILGNVTCRAGSTNLPNSTVDAARVEVQFPGYGESTIRATRCNLKLQQARIRSSVVTSVLVVESTSTLQMDQTEIDSLGYCLTIGGVASIRNSTFRNCKGQGARGGVFVPTTGTNGSVEVSFSSFYNTYLRCNDGALSHTFRNSIFLNDDPAAPTDTVLGAKCRFEYSLIKPQSTTPYGANNLLNVDPRFVNAAMGDLHLAAGSPAIDAADPAATETTDFDGTTRPQGAGRDIGAFEYKP